MSGNSGNKWTRRQLQRNVWGLPWIENPFEPVPMSHGRFTPIQRFGDSLEPWQWLEMLRVGAAGMETEIRGWERQGEPGRAGIAILAMKNGASDSHLPQPALSSTRDAWAAPRLIFAGLWQKEGRHQFNDLQGLLEAGLLPNPRPRLPIPASLCHRGKEAGLAKCSHPLDLHLPGPAFKSSLSIWFSQAFLPRLGLRPEYGEH